MDEKLLKKIGFVKNVEDDFYYYTMDIGSTCLITNANDEGEWRVSFLHDDNFEVSDFDDLKKLVDILNKYVVSK